MKELTENAKITLTQRYLLKNEKGEVIETIPEMFKRIANAVAEAEMNYDQGYYIDGKDKTDVYYNTRDIFLDIMENLDFLPNSPTIMNAGKEEGQLSACFVLPIEDSMESIFETLKKTALIHKSGGGTGFSFSRIREKDAVVKTTGGVASGPISFMKIYNAATEEVKQGGCFVGETLIATGRGPVMIKDLKEDDLVYSYGPNGFTLSPCSAPWMTMKNAEVWKITLDNGVVAYATPNHPFLTRWAYSGAPKVATYIQLKDLKPGTPLMPLTRYIKSGEYFIALHDGADTHMPEHVWIANHFEYDYTKGRRAVHHIDENHLNNNLDNLAVISASEHAKYHNKVRVENKTHPFYYLTEEQKEKGRENWKKWFYSLTPEERKEYDAKVSAGLSRSNKERIAQGIHNFVTNPPMRDPEIVKKATMSRIAGTLWEIMGRGYRNFTEDDLTSIYEKENFPQQNMYRKETINKFFGSFDNALAYANSRNTKVVSVEFSHYADVWNVEVYGTHNYVVCTPDMTHGVVVSNSRRGASMGMLRVDHPDILDFIDCKTVDGVLNNFNISVALTDVFMNAVKEDKEYDLVSPKDGKVVKTLRAKDVFDKLVTNAWNNGEPGIFFIDRANEHNPTPNEGEYESTNPCGEQILLPNESCNLGSINLANMVIEKSFNTMIQWKDIFKYDKIIDINNLEAALVGVIDFDKLQYVVENAVRFLDDVIDVNCFPFKEIEEQTKRNRKIGLGIMGFAEMLVKIGVPYNSELGRKVAEVVMKFISNTAINASIKLARVRGTFPTYEDSTWKLMDAKMRNATVTTLAPTGTISLIAGTSSGIEPYFSFAYERHILDGKTLLERNELLAEVLKEYGIYSDELIKKIVNNHGMLKGITEIPEEIRSVFVSAHEISPKDHILMQAAFQKYVDNAISKTINFTNDATKEDIYNAFMLAYNSGCKGTTVYRDGSRSTQVLTTSSTDKKDEENDSNIDVYNRPKKLYGSTKTIKIGCGKILVTVNHDNNNKVKEVIIISGKGGGCHAQSEAIGRLISISLRANVDINEIIHQLRGIRCDACKKKGLDGISCPDAIGRFIEEEQKLLDHEVITIHPTIEEIEESVVEEPVNASNKCPQCGAQLAHESGCVKCYNCDYSKCD